MTSVARGARMSVVGGELPREQDDEVVVVMDWELWAFEDEE